MLGLGLGHVPELGELEEDLGLHEIVGEPSQAGLEQLGSLEVPAELGGEARQVRARATIAHVLSDGSCVRVEGDLVVVKLGLGQLADAS